MLTWHAVGHVLVSDSDASGGMTIKPMLSSNDGNNVNWDFTESEDWQAWDGSAGNNFADANNWTPAGIPGNTSKMLIDGPGATAPVVSGVSTVAQLVVGGGADATLTLNAALTVTGNCSVLTSGTLTHQANTTTHLYDIDLTVGGALSVDGAIDVSGRGYSAQNGPGKATSNQGGGGYGGEGGDWGGRIAYVGRCYGSVTTPNQLGSGGTGGPGGGAIRLQVAGNTRVDGTIAADGLIQGSTGAGSGGSVWLTSGSLAGSGLIRADGGQGGTYSGWGYGHGGGGRVAVRLTGSDDFGDVDIRAISKRGANGNHRGGGAGSVYLKGVSDTHGVCTYDNRDVPNVWRSVINAAVTNVVVGDFVLRGSTTTLILQTNQTLTLHGGWSNSAASFTADQGSTVHLAGTNDVTVDGSTTFENLTCTNGGKTIFFSSGDTFAANNLLTLKGEAANLLTLTGTTASAWSMNVPVATHPIRYIDVAYSDASGGASITAFDSTDSGNNVNWIFADTGVATNTWIGVSNTVWSTDANWDKGRPPIGSDYVVISNPCAYYPILDNEKVIAGLTIESGASLQLNNWSLTLTNSGAIAGTLTASGTETFEVRGHLDLSSAVFNSAQTTVRLAGTTPQLLEAPTTGLYALDITNSSATVTIDGNLTATSLVSRATTVVCSNDVALSDSLTLAGGSLFVTGALQARQVTHNGSGLVCAGTATVTERGDIAGNAEFRAAASVPHARARRRQPELQQRPDGHRLHVNRCRQFDDLCARF